MNIDRNANTKRVRYYLASARASVGFDELLAQPLLCALAAEDACWTLAIDDWRRRMPRRWQRRKLRGWAAEGRALFAEQAQLQELALRHGVPV